MQPTSYPIEQSVLKEFWQLFISTGNLSEIDDPRCDPAVLNSWQRCSLRFAPESRPRTMIRDEAGLAAIFKTQSMLIEVAIPYLEDIYQFIEGSNSAIMLADGAGCILAMHGDQDMLDMLNKLNAGVGAYWAEGYLGTNAFGLALLSAMPAQVVGAEHYFEMFHHLTTSAAPIHHVTGRIIGLLGVVTLAKETTSHTLGLVMEAARAVNNQLHTNLYVEETNRSLSELKGILDGLSVGVLTWDRNYHINHVNSRAEDILEINCSALVGKPLWDMISCPPSIRNAIQEEQELDEVEFNIKVQGQVINVSASLRRIYDSDRQLNGSVMILRAIEDVHQLIYRQGKSDPNIRFEKIVAHSGVMQSVLRQARIAARSGTPILLWGETGVGKNFLARAIHNEGQRANKPFVSVNCGTIPHELMLGTLLGYGYQDNTPRGLLSKFELARGGTLLLDQIHTLSLEVQNALLNAIETGTIPQLGENWEVPLDVRIIGTTQKDLAALSQAGLFLPDLYFRFGVTNLHIPPLRERADEIPELVLRFLHYLSSRLELKDPIQLEDGVMEILKQYPWPENVRELENTLESAVYKRYDHILRVADLPSFIRIGGSGEPEGEDQPVMSAAEAEREAVIRAGWACEGRVGEMAELLGMGRTTLWRKMKEMNISADYFKR